MRYKCKTTSKIFKFKIIVYWCVFSVRYVLTKAGCCVWWIEVMLHACECVLKWFDVSLCIKTIKNLLKLKKSLFPVYQKNQI